MNEETKQALISGAQEIFSETEEGRNTAQRVGQELIDIIEAMDDISSQMGTDLTETASELLRRIQGTSESSVAFTDPQVNLGVELEDWSAVVEKLDALGSGDYRDTGHYLIGARGVKVDVWNYVGSLAEKNYTQVMAGPVKLSQGKIVQASEFHILYRICSLGIWGEWNDFQDSSLTDLSTLQSALTAATNAATAAQTAALSAQTLASNASTSVSSLSTQVQTLNDTVKELSEGSSGNIYPFDLWVEKEETIDEVEAETGEIAWVVDGMLFLEKYDSGWRSSTSTSVDYNVLRDSGEALFQMGNSLYRFNGKKLLRLTDESDLENLAAAEESENTSQAAAGIYPFDLWVEQEESLLTLESSKEGDIAWVVDGKMFLQRATSVSAWHTKTVYNELRDTALFSCGQNLYRYDGSKMVRLVDENDLSSLQSGASSSSSSTGSSSEELIRYYRRAIDLMPGENLICDGNFWFAGNNLGSSVYSALGLKYWAGGGLNSNTVTANSRFGYVSDVPYDSLIANDEEKILYKGMSYALSFYCWGSCSALEVLASTQTLLSKGEIADTGEATAEATADAAYVSLSFTAEANSSLIFHNPDNQKIFIAHVKLCVRSSPTICELEKRLSSIEQALTSSGISFEQIGE